MFRNILIVFLATASAALAAAESTFLVSAANVRLRSAAGADAAVVQMLPLGTRLVASGPEQADGWLPVRTPEEGGPQGWISAALIIPVTDTNYPEVAAGLISTRLARDGDGFSARLELLDLVESMLERVWSADDRSRLTLQRLQSLQRVLAGIPWNRKLWDEALHAWVRDRAGEIRYNEPGGSWLIRPETIFAAHERNRDTAAADEIAWFAVGNGLGGECEGNVVCYLQRLDTLHGEYLRREPDGKHIDETVAWLIQRVEDYTTGQHGENGPAQYEFNAGRECAALGKVVASLDSAAAGTRASQRNVLTSKLRELAKPCS